LTRIATLVKDKGALDATTDSATRAADRKRAELERLQAELAAITLVEASSGLTPALLDAQAYRQSEAKLRSLQDAIAAASIDVQARLEALGQWQRGIAELRAMAVPAGDTVTQQRTERQNLVLELRKAREGLEEAKTRVGASELDIAQYREAR
jgi:chromosome segregation ATPase